MFVCFGLNSAMTSSNDGVAGTAPCRVTANAPAADAKAMHCCK